MQILKQHTDASQHGVPGKLLKNCDEQLAEVFTRIFNLYFMLEMFSACLESVINLPVHKKTSASAVLMTSA